MSVGLGFLCRLLNASSAVQMASIIVTRISYDVGFLIDAFKEDPYDWVYGTEKGIAAEEGQELLFEDDSLVDGPNAAWPWSTSQKVSIDYFEEGKQPLRKWAYVMWDHGRLERWGILDVTPEQVCNLHNTF